MATVMPSTAQALIQAAAIFCTQNHISLARLYALNGETAQAAGAYAEAQRLLANTDKVLSPQMHELALDYLKAAGRYPEALRRARQYLDEARVGE